MKIKKQLKKLRKRIVKLSQQIKTPKQLKKLKKEVLKLQKDKPTEVRSIGFVQLSNLNSDNEYDELDY